ncbi:hypothetical protein [Lysobacter sp. CFH 32150]|uniref:hypothetical protein n=1 Tax=Lysobacter sp. CFH 32150 TaxID=2927128 RepID=UPI001FA80D39|nr:hypothetical protein [Lysobacter sp. CFH 32150]MCI4566929.1 hypothetical protein [Lysobacter sp. CFH 32150]
MLRLTGPKNNLTKAALIALAVGLFAVYLFYARGFETTALIAVGMLCFGFNTFFLAAPSRVMRGRSDIRGVAIFIGMLIANVSILVITDFNVWLLLIFWIPAIVGLLAGYFDRIKGSGGR